MFSGPAGLDLPLDPAQVFAEADAFMGERFTSARRWSMHRDRVASLWRAIRHGKASPLLRAFRGVDARGGRLCLLAHHDPDGRIDPYVIAYIDSLVAAGFDVILSSSAPSLAPADVDQARARCLAVLHRRNEGLDFGSWKDALSWCSDWQRYDLIVLANDSVYGPLQPLAPIIAEMDRRPCDFWGITDCHVMGHHLQTYFVAFKRAALQSPVFRDFWERFVFFGNKDNVIRDYEVGLSRRLWAAGLRPGVWSGVAALEDRLAGDPSAGEQLAGVDPSATRTSSPPITRGGP